MQIYAEKRQFERFEAPQRQVDTELCTIGNYINHNLVT